MIAYLVLHIKQSLFRNKQNQFRTCISFPHCILVKGLMANFIFWGSRPKFWLTKLIFGHFWAKKIKKKFFKKFATIFLAIKFVLYIGNIINGKFSDFQIFALFGKKSTCSKIGSKRPAKKIGLYIGKGINGKF